MKKYVLPLALISMVTLQACNEETAKTDTAKADAAVVLETTSQRLSYGIAYGMGSRMSQDSVPLDVNAFTAGLSDAMNGVESRMTEEEIAAEMQAYQEKAVAEQQAAQAVAGEAAIAAGAAFLAENAAKEGVVVTESGLQYEILEAGDGPLPSAEDTVEVHYRGTLMDGTEFDSSYSRNQTASFGVTQVIPGWVEALQMMPVGSKWKLVIPSELAYGAGGAGGSIGPNATLVFEVELISIADKVAAEAAPEAAEG
ncbi:MAG: FKBP-type peptidyl-prolyl cis-trans isomerase [Proteobacteria bacterium]|nr:FKBP-type peptidyl-prolyl cis-trans isomerase [Pseudomonadota bacterium]